ncbi:TetR/AcrR family transcriptional regulator [Gilvimarinus sp. F26214L]|uniref:TetR/AcrR family transcriptional regulator n=1 Tax=Gilvimarinus sp. DZF01 TaxID=3461371 RepID=UPI0040453CD3
MEKTQRKIEKFRQREQKILDAALELLVEHGEETVTVEQIANHVDIGKGTIYKHFTSKVEIYMRLLFDYERQLLDRLKDAIKAAEGGDYAAPARAYFESRMSDPTKDRLFQRLEEKIIALKQAPELIAELHQMRNNVFEAMNDVLTRRIQEGYLQDVPPHYYYYTYWALTQGAVELFHSKAFPRIEDNMEGLMKFIMEVGVHMGNRKPDNNNHSGPATSPAG